MHPSTLKQALKKYWGHDEFRPFQQNIIQSILSQKDTLAILPTGGGKSVCYQLPAILQEGTCLVISPLTALIEDQIAQLKQKGISAINIPSNAKTDDVIRIFDNLKHTSIPLLYLTPERLINPLVLEKLTTINLSFIAVDEAHCISQWGHDFRPSYLKISTLRTILPNKKIIALTATATIKTQNQIIALLQLNQPQLFISSFHRPNLAYQVLTTPHKQDLLIKILQRQNQPCIVYLQNRLGVQRLSQLLNKFQIKSTYYHAGLDLKTKQQNFDLWSSETHPVMVATNAFGMGIDKDNVKLVVHLEIPNTIENYTQEAGRAGRNEQKAFSVVILSKNEVTMSHQKLNRPILFKDILNVYLKLNQHFNIALGEFSPEKFLLDINVFAQKYKISNHIIRKALTLLHNFEIIYLDNKKQQHPSIQILVRPTSLLQTQNCTKEVHVILDYLVRHYPGIFEIQKDIYVHQVSKDLRMSHDQLDRIFSQLHQKELLCYKPISSLDQITFLKPREDRRTLNPVKKQIEELFEIEQTKTLESIAFFKNNKTCRNKKILKYFDETSIDDCGICDICLDKKAKHSSQSIQQKLIQTLKNKPFHYNDLLLTLKISTHCLDESLNLLLKQNIIQEQHHQYTLL